MCNKHLFGPTLMAAGCNNAARAGVTKTTLELWIPYRWLRVLGHDWILRKKEIDTASQSHCGFESYLFGAFDTVSFTVPPACFTQWVTVDNSDQVFWDCAHKVGRCKCLRQSHLEPQILRCSVAVRNAHPTFYVRLSCIFQQKTFSQAFDLFCFVRGAGG